ncbi:hypothetical protein [Clavibacter zhangzhiyongii]|uniref:hypothetical protein n=1 Tax=Clavibacter zhangzhiyongii TaxID=2768071 RepID=UPI0039E0AE88
MPSTTPTVVVTTVAETAMSIDTRAPYAIRAKTSRPFCGSTPNQCEALTPPNGPMGRPPRTGSTAVASKVVGPQPVIPDRSGAKIASTMTSTTNATLAMTDGVDRRAATTRLAGVTAGGRPVG